MTASSLSASLIVTGLRVLAISTLTPFDSRGVMTMKIISTTSITSTIGVTLISETGGGAFFSSIRLISLKHLFAALAAVGAAREGRAGRDRFQLVPART